MAPADWRPLRARPQIAFIPGLPRVSGVASHSGPERRPRAVATPQSRRALVGSDLFPFSRLDDGSQQGNGNKARTPYRHTDEARRKISAANKGNVPWNKGRKHSEETKRKIAARTKMAMKAPNVREKLRQQATGRKHSDETKRKIRNASRIIHGRMANLGVKKSRTPVPFKFSNDLVATLDSRISKRFDDEFMDAANYSPAGRLRKPMSEETKKKLSARIKEMWSSPDYREKVLSGIEAHQKKRESSPLSEEHKEAIRQTLLKRNAALRKDEGRDTYTRMRRRARTRNSSLDPTEGTRFSSRNMSSADLRDREERRLRISQILQEAEDKELSEVDDFESSARRKRDAEALLKQQEAEEDLRETNRMLLESLASAGQLPPLDDEGPLFNSSPIAGDSTSGGDTGSLFDIVPGTLEDSDFLGSDMSLGGTGPLRDPLLVSPEMSLVSPLSSVQHNFNDVFVSADEQPVAPSTFPFAQVPSAEAGPARSSRKPRKSAVNMQDDTFGIPLTESVPLGQRLMFGEQEEEREGIDSEVEEDEDDSADVVEDDDTRIVANPLVPPSEFSDPLINLEDMDSGGSSGYADGFETSEFGSSLLTAASQDSKRIVTYVNGKRVFQS